MSAARAPADRRPVVRLALVALLAVVWLLPWAEVQAPLTGGLLAQSGAARTGLIALAALVLLWGLALAAALGANRRALQAGEAFASAALAATFCVLAVLDHPFLPALGRPAAWLSAFAPLALLCLLDGVTRLGAASGASELLAVRVGAALFAAGALWSDGAPLLAALALWPALAPLAFVPGRDAGAARRSLEGLLLGGALLAGFAPTLARHAAPVAPAVGGVQVAAVVWSVLAALVVLTCTAGLFAPREPAAGA